MSWDSEFAEPIHLPNNAVATTLRQVIGYISKLPDAEQNSQEWQKSPQTYPAGRGSNRVNLVRAHLSHAGTSAGRRETLPSKRACSFFTGLLEMIFENGTFGLPSRLRRPP